MKKSLLLGVALATLALCAPASAELKFKPGEDPALQLGEFRRSQEGRPQGRDADDLRTVARRGRRPRPQRSRLFLRGDRRRDQVLLVGELRAADRHRHAGRQPAQHRHPAAARPDPGPGVEGPADAARRRHRQLGQGQLRRRPVLGRSRHLQGQGRQAGLLRLPLQGRREVAGLVLAGQFRGSRLQGAEDPGRTGRARAEDHRRRRQAVVHRPRLRRRHRLAGDRLGRGHHAAHPGARRLRQVDQERDPVQRSGGRQRHRHLRQDRHRRQDGRRRRRRRLPRPTSATARRASSRCRRSATCTIRRRSSRPSSRKAPSSARTPTSSTSRPMPPSRNSATRCSAPARWP